MPTEKTIMIYTANAAGGDEQAHRSIETAARRIADVDGKAPYGGYWIVRCTGIHADVADDVRSRAREIFDRAAIG